MKFLVVLIVLLGGVWLWRRARLQRPPDAPAPPPEPARPPAKGTPPAEMVACAHCGVHLPSAEAVAGTRGHYCGDAHRRLAEGDSGR